jgi:hypothetical protein
MRTVLARAGLVLGVMLTPAATLRADPTPWIAVVVPAAVGDRLDGRALSLIFRRRQLYAEDGGRWQPVNLPADHALRRRFSHAVLGASPEALEDYWNQQYFQGLLPPHVLGSEHAVLRFVVATPYAIGYVSACLPQAGLRTVLMIDPDGGERDPRDAPPCAAVAPG